MVDAVMFSSDSQEWETPDYLFEFLQDLYGPFDLDPAATNENSKCDLFYDKELDGLFQDWFGKVFTNPPYGRGKITEKWVNKMFDEMEREEVGIVVALLPARTETVWFHRVLNHCVGIGVIRKKASGGWFSDYVATNVSGMLRIQCEVWFVKTRLKFLEDGIEGKNQAPFPSVVVIFGRNEQWRGRKSKRRRGRRKAAR